jgi:hypothetical protein
VTGVSRRAIEFDRSAAIALQGEFAGDPLIARPFATTMDILVGRCQRR